jgi:Tol biopolymer transport system component
VPPRGIFENPSQWSPDGTSILFAQPNPGTNWDLMLAPVDGSHPPARVAASPANEMAGVISPDSRWLIYTSDESGRVGMYARPLASPGPRQQVQIGTSGFNGIASTNGFDWSGDGRELVVMASDVMAYAVQAGDALRIGAPRRLFAMPAAAITLAPSRDHQRFLVTLPVADGPPPALAVEANWAAALRRR